MIRKAIIEAVRLAFTGLDRKGYLHRVHVMYTSQKWSAL